jgi:hypothetical protein
MRDLELDLLFDFARHNLFLRERSDDFFKARVAAQLVPARIKL